MKYIYLWASWSLCKDELNHTAATISLLTVSLLKILLM